MSHICTFFVTIVTMATATAQTHRPSRLAPTPIDVAISPPPGSTIAVSLGQTIEFALALPKELASNFQLVWGREQNQGAPTAEPHRIAQGSTITTSKVFGRDITRSGLLVLSIVAPQPDGSNAQVSTATFNLVVTADPEKMAAVNTQVFCNGGAGVGTPFGFFWATGGTPMDGGYYWYSPNDIEVSFPPSEFASLAGWANAQVWPGETTGKKTLVVENGGNYGVCTFMQTSGAFGQ